MDLSGDIDILCSTEVSLGFVKLIVSVERLRGTIGVGVDCGDGTGGRFKGEL